MAGMRIAVNIARRSHTATAREPQGLGIAVEPHHLRAVSRHAPCEPARAAAHVEQGFPRVRVQ